MNTTKSDEQACREILDGLGEISLYNVPIRVDLPRLCRIESIDEVQEELRTHIMTWHAMISELKQKEKEIRYNDKWWRESK